MRWAKKTDTGSTGWQVVEGDTGWRDITATRDASTAATTSLYIRRVGATVSWSGAVLRDLFTAGTAEPVCAIPGGFFRSLPGTSTQDFTVLDRNGGTRSLFIWARSTTLQTYVRAGGNLAGGSACLAGVSWPTNDPWPTTLPGVAG